MQFDRRFADYGLTGGFFLICEFVLLLAFGYWPKLQALRLPLPADTSVIGPIMTGFAGALGIIAVFVFGLLLDLLASLFRVTEMRVFTYHLNHNNDWLIQLAKDHKAYCGRDYETVQNAFGALGQLPLTRQLRAGFTDESFRAALRFTVMPWKRDVRLRYLVSVRRLLDSLESLVILWCPS
jgi:hypothetical protein